MATALITGASGGIGYELAKLFAQHDYDIIAVARNEEKLSNACEALRHFGGSVQAYAADLSRYCSKHVGSFACSIQGMSINLFWSA